MRIHFSHPQYLLLLPLLWGYTLWVLRASLADLGRARGWFTAGVRLALIALLVFALAGVQWVRRTTTLCTIFVVDISDSVNTAQQQDKALQFITDALKKRHLGDQFALVAFGAEALLDHAPEDTRPIKQIVSIPGKTRTDIAAGIQLAMASFPQEMGKQVVLFTDGNENLGDAVEQAELAYAGGVRISVVPLAQDLSHESLLLRADAPAEITEGAPFQVSVLAESRQEVDGAVTLSRDGQPVETRAVHLKAGKNIVTFEQTLRQSGFFKYEAKLAMPHGQDTIPDNNIVYAYTHVAGKPRVLIVEGAPGEGAYLARTLAANDLQIDYGGPDLIPKNLAECARYQAVLFANVPAWRMSPIQMQVIRSAVRDTGMGFAMLGGAESFGAGGYFHTPIEEALPVNMEPKKKKDFPSLTLVIVIDVSGSMGEPEDGVPKIRLAAEAAAAAIDLLQPTDQIAVIGYDTKESFDYVVRMSVASNKKALIDQVYRLQPGGGGIEGYSALLEAHKAIKGSHTQIKHIIFCADAADDDEPGDSVNMARRMLAQEKITLTTIGFGTKTDKDWPLYQQMAKAGGGTAYLAERLSNLPQIFSRDVLTVAQTLINEKPFNVRQGDRSHPIMQGIPWAAAPPLLGYVSTGAKDTPSARVLLSSPKKEPVLAAWPYGLGRSLAFTSDATSHWGVKWLPWGAYPPFWSQSLRWVLRQGEKGNFQTAVTENHGRATITVEAIAPNGEFRNLLDLRAHVAHISTGSIEGPQAVEHLLPLSQVAPGRYEADFEAMTPGIYTVTVEEQDNNRRTGLNTMTLVIPYSPEYQTARANESLLARVAERARGAFGPEAADIFGKRIGFRTLQDLWPILLLVMATLFLFDVAARRILLPWNEIAAATAGAVVRYLPRRSRRVHPEKRRSDSMVGSLLTTRESKRPATEEQEDETPAATSTFGKLKQTLDATRTPPPVPSVTPPATSAQPAPPPEPTVSAGTTSALLRKKRERQEDK